MIERKFIAQKTKEYQIHEYIKENLKNVGHSRTKMVKTPLGEKIILYASRPGLIVGRKGQNIKELTKTLKKKFGLENPQIEVSEVTDINLDANIVAERIANSLERFGTQRFKAIGHRVMEDALSAGALGIEIIVSGKIPSSRAKSWRFYSGYLKKCGDVAIVDVDKAHVQAKLKTGVVGIKVSLMPPGIKLPDKVEFIEEKEKKIEDVSEEGKSEKSEDGKKVPENQQTKKTRFSAPTSLETKSKAKKTAKSNSRTKSNAMEKETKDKNPDEEKAEKKSAVKLRKEPAPNAHDEVKNES